MSQPQEWRQSIGDSTFLISTDRSRIDEQFIQTAFATDDMYWAKPLPLADQALMLDNSLTLSVYRLPPTPSSDQALAPASTTTAPPAPQQLGFARLITDRVTFAYLTDVYLAPESRGLGLGLWLMRCCEEAMQGMPGFRRAMLMASGKGPAFYGECLGFYEVEREKEKTVCMTRRAWS